MNDAEERVLVAQQQMDAARFAGYEVLDVARVVRDARLSRARAEADLKVLEADLARVAAVLALRADTVGEDARAARGAIAGHFAAGTLAVAQARAAFEAATEDLEYRHYLML